MNKIVFLQPGYAHYRNKLFTLLSQEHNLTFIYTSSKNVYPGDIEPGPFPHYFVEKRFGLISLGLIYSLLYEKPDIVISSISSSLQTVIAYVYAYLFRKNMILWIEEWAKPQYSGISFKNILRTLRFFIGKRIIIGSDALIASGTASFKYAVSLGKREKDIFVTVQCSEDIANTQNVSKKNNSGRITFLYLSRIIDWKGLDFLLKAFSKLEIDRSDISLLVAGDGPFKTECVKLAESLKIKHIEFIGSVDPENVGDIFSKVDVFVLPSCFRSNTYEAWGLVINEAMSMSLPIITTSAVGASSDMVLNQKNGIIVRDSNVSELYKAMKEILNYNIVKMGQVSRKIFEEKNNFEKMSATFTSAINHLNK